MSNEVHHCRGKICCYVLQCEPCPQTGREIRYVGVTKDAERRTAQHCGMKAGGAKWTADHSPVDVLSVRICETDEEAAVMECMLWTLHAAKVGYDYCRGGRWNMTEKMKYVPPGFSEENSGPPLTCPHIPTGKEEFGILGAIKP